VQIWLEYALATCLLFALQILPMQLASRVARFATKALDLAMPKLRRTGLINLAFAYPRTLPEQRIRTIDGVFESIARLLVAIAKFPKLNAQNIHQWIRYEGLENYTAAKNEGRGVLVATAHLGNWELSAFSHALMTEPMNVMVRPLDNPLIDAVIETRRQQSGNRLIFKKDAVRTVIKALRANEAVGILIDQNTTPAEGVFVDFFGKLACAGTAFAKLAQHSGAAVVPGFALWEASEKRYVLHFYPKLEMTGDIAADTQRIHSFFETVIREYPDQWLWIHRRWKTRPPGEPPLY
jgi:Kdo2-lipid IVA lauroyltransferase/acyltransferase